MHSVKTWAIISEVPADSRDLNYSNYYEDGNEKSLKRMNTILIIQTY